MSENLGTPAPLANSRAVFRVLTVAGVVTTTVLLVMGWIPRVRARSQRQENLHQLVDAKPKVTLIQPREEKSDRNLTLPASLEAFQEIKVQARADGYVGKWFVDIGDSVHAGQVLALIEVPELQQKRAQAQADEAEAEAQVAQAESDVRTVESEKSRLLAEEEQARAEVGQARAEILARQSDAEFARVSNDRWQKLVAEQAISLQEADQRQHLYQAARANVQSAQERLLASQSRVKAAGARQLSLQAEVNSALARVRSGQARVRARQAVVDAIDTQIEFCTVRAPFSGIITRRNIELGTLVSAGGDKTTLYELAQSRRLRVIVDVPQGDAEAIRVGQKAQVKLSGQLLPGVVTRTAGALDADTRTLRTQVEIDNPGGHLEAGMHAEVSLTVQNHGHAVVIPATTMVVRAEGAHVYVVDAGGQVHLRAIELGLDYGKEVQVVSGLSGTDRVVNFPSDSLSEGTMVESVKP